MTPTEWPATFAEGWRCVKPAGFIDYFLPLIEEDAVFTQPLARTAKGHSQIRALFEQLFTRFPDFMVTPFDSQVDGDVVTIRSTCTVTVGRQHLSFPVQDRLHLRFGKIIRREASFSPRPILLAVIRNPRILPRLFARKPGPTGITAL